MPGASSLKVLVLGPSLLDWDAPVARDEDVQVVLVRHAVPARIHASGCDVAVGLVVVRQAPAKPDERGDRGRPGPPEPVRVVVADDPRERIPTREEFERS